MICCQARKSMMSIESGLSTNVQVMTAKAYVEKSALYVCCGNALA